MTTSHRGQAAALLARIPDQKALPPQMQVAIVGVHAVIALVDAIEQLRSDYSAWRLLQ